MVNVYNCKIYWVSAKNGGREKHPEGKQYSTVAMFEDVRDRWPDEAWSVMIDFIKHEGDCSEGNIRFLVEWAPNNLLYAGCKFELFEANKKVATGEVT